MKTLHDILNTKENRIKAINLQNKENRIEKNNILNDIFSQLIALHNDNNFIISNTKNKKEKRKTFISSLNDKYEVSTNEIKEMLKAIQNYSDSKIYLDFTQKELLSDSETKNPIYISLTAFKFYFTQKELFKNNISTNKDFIIALSDLRKELKVISANKVLNK